MRNKDQRTMHTLQRNKKVLQDQEDLLRHTSLNLCTCEQIIMILLLHMHISFLQLWANG